MFRFRNNSTGYFLLILLIVVFAACRPKADLVVYHGKVYTVDSNFTVTEAFAVKDGKIIAMGKSDSIINAFSTDSIINAEGCTVFPGFIDAHAHFVGYGRSLFEVNLYDCKSWDEVVSRVKTFAAASPNEKWIRGRGWDQNLWPSHTFPDNKLLNQLFPDKPVLLDRVDGHAVVANDKALALAGITASTTIVGGSIEVKDGKPTGTLVDNAAELVKKIVDHPSMADYEKWLIEAQQRCFEQGLTTITDCGLFYYDINAIDSLQKSGKLKMRIYAMLSDDTANFNRYLAKGPYKTDRLYVKGVKAYADGALGSRGACLLHPYNDKPGWTGFLLHGREHYDSLASMLVGTDFQLCTHAIGDSGNRIVLQVYNKYLKGKNDKRWRIEHAQVVNEADFDLFGKTSVIPSVQPTHATSDMGWAAERVGEERLKDAYAYRKLLGQNGWIPLGTDFPVEDISPFKTFLAATARRDAKGNPPNGFQVDNGLTRAQALKGMTIWAAKADCLEKEVGSLQPGKKADFVILDSDMMETRATKLLDIKVLYTYIGGQRVFGRKSP